MYEQVLFSCQLVPYPFQSYYQHGKLSLPWFLKQIIAKQLLNIKMQIFWCLTDWIFFVIWKHFLFNWYISLNKTLCTQSLSSRIMYVFKTGYNFGEHFEFGLMLFFSFPIITNTFSSMQSCTLPTSSKRTFLSCSVGFRFSASIWRRQAWMCR